MVCSHRRSDVQKNRFVVTFVLLLTAISLLILIFLYNEYSYCEYASCVKISSQIHESIDFDADPCTDFYNFSCGNFQSPLGSVLSSHDNKIEMQLKTIILEAVNKTDKKALTLMKQFYISCMNLTAIDNDNDTTFWDLIRRLGGWPVVMQENWNASVFNFADFIITMRKLGLKYDWFLDISTYFGSDVNSSLIKISYPETASVIQPDFRHNYANLLKEVAILYGAPEYVAKVEMREVMLFEIKLANLIEESKEELIDKHICTIAELPITFRALKKIKWMELLRQVTNNQLSDHDQVAFFARNYLSKLDKLLQGTTVRTQVNYVVWKLIEVYTPLLSKKIREKIAKFKGLNSQDRHGYCLERSRSLFQYAVEAVYLRRFVDRSKRLKIENMIERIKHQLGKKLSQASWMDQKTKKAALAKLRNVSFIVGGPEEMYYINQFDRYIGVENMEFRTSNAIEIVTEITSKNLDTIFDLKHERNLHIHKHHLYQLVCTSKAQFLRDYNLLYIPAGMLQSPYYEEDRPNYLNYATLGFAIGRELTRGFDTRSIGEIDWWSASTTQNFQEFLQCLLNICIAGTNEANSTIQCDQKLLESLEDNTGINIAYGAYQDLVSEDGQPQILPGLHFTGDQLFWMAYTYLWCQSNQPAVMYKLKVLGPLRNSLYFSKDFVCPINSNMNPLIKCDIL